MHTIKLVVIGASGVGKTSLRGQYISGRFTSGYRATIGTDFIAKTLPHPVKPEQSVTLQIWDTAGQERFSSLSAAFFRGADAVILMFDIHQDDTLDALHKWWGEFCEGLPLREEDMLEYPSFVVGNKIDLVGDGVDDQETRVSGNRIHEFLAEIIPHGSSPPLSSPSETPAGSPVISIRKSPSIDIKPRVSPPEATTTRPKTPDRDRTHIQTPSRSLLGKDGKFNTLSSINSTTTSVYLTPSSSLFSDSIFHTARSSPEQSTSVPPISSVITPSSSTMTPAARQRRLTTLSTGSGSASSESAATITPSTFARSKQENATANGGKNNSNGRAITTPGGNNHVLDPPRSSSPFPSSHSSIHWSSGGSENGPGRPPPPSPPEHGPSLHFTSAKTGEGVRELFEHVTERVMRKLAYEEYFESRRMHYRETSEAETVRLGTGAGARSQKQQQRDRGVFDGCCT